MEIAYSAVSTRFQHDVGGICVLKGEVHRCIAVLAKVDEITKHYGRITHGTSPRSCCSLFWKQEMEITLVGLQNAGKSTLVNVIAVTKLYQHC